jgi:porin
MICPLTHVTNRRVCCFTLLLVGVFAPNLVAQTPENPGRPSSLPLFATSRSPSTEFASDGNPPQTEAPPVPAPAFAGAFLDRPKLTGDWLGLREDLRDKGVTFDLSATEYYQGVASGGVQDTFRFGGRGDYLLNVDGEKAGLWKGLFINVHAESVYGDSVNSATGALMPVNIGRLLPIPSGSITTITGVKITQALSENFAVFAGKINTFDGFVQPFLPGHGLDVGFMNLAMVLNPALARTVPYSTLGAGAAILVEGQPLASVMVLDTNNTPTQSGFNTFFNNGATILGQGTLPTKFFNLPGYHTLIGTYSSGQYTETSPDAYSLISNLAKGLPLLGKISGSWSLDYMASQSLWTDPNDSTRNWGVFGNFGLSDGNPNPIHYAINAGFSGASPLSGRKLDTFGVGYYYLGLSNSLKSIAPRFVPIRDEQGIELFYNIAATPWCRITPDIQIITPARESVSPSFIFGIRARMDF